jgi:hypothetical protein
MHLWMEKILRARALVTCEFYHGEALPNCLQWTVGVSSNVTGRENFRKILSHHLKSSADGGRRFQGVGAAHAAMMVVIPNRLLWPNWGWSLRIPPLSWS